MVCRKNKCICSLYIKPMHGVQKEAKKKPIMRRLLSSRFGAPEETSDARNLELKGKGRAGWPQFKKP